MEIYNIYSLQEYLEEIFKEMGINNAIIRDCYEKQFAIEIIYNNKKIILDEYGTIDIKNI